MQNEGASSRAVDWQCGVTWPVTSLRQETPFKYLITRIDFTPLSCFDTGQTTLGGFADTHYPAPSIWRCHLLLRSIHTPLIFLCVYIHSSLHTLRVLVFAAQSPFQYESPAIRQVTAGWVCNTKTRTSIRRERSPQQCKMVSFLEVSIIVQYHSSRPACELHGGPTTRWAKWKSVWRSAIAGGLFPTLWLIYIQICIKLLRVV